MSRDTKAALSPCVSLDLLEYENRMLRIDGSVSDEILASGSFAARLNGVELSVRFSKRFAQIRIDNQFFSGRTAFALELPMEKLQKKNVLEFIQTRKAGHQSLLPLLAVSYQARLCSELKHAWWRFEDYVVTLRQSRMGERTAKPPKTRRFDIFSDGLLICRKGRLGRLAQEVRFLKEIVCAPYGSRQMFLMRLLYWLSYPVYARKNIWITFDKLYKGGDCGEYFYKYMADRSDRTVIPAYVINASAPDYKRLRREGYRPLAYRSRQQRLSYLYATMVFGTHSGVNSFCGFNNWEIRFVQDRLRAVNTCIQHGLSVQNLSADSNRVINNNKRYYCASRCEVENLSRPQYDYDLDALRLTGIPRYDGLVNRDKKQILIAPTWRSYLAMPSVMGAARDYNPEFKSTEYYMIFQRLLENQELADVARRSGYRIVYLLHPVISAQKEDFHTAEGVELYSALEVSYEKLLTQSSLMVTDYSGVQFDFAYMRKPLVYFHPPELPPHYDSEGFDYERQGFGEICTDTAELVRTLCDYMENGCQIREFYRGRQEGFFAFQDHENCRRIYEDALEYYENRRAERRTATCFVSDNI